MRDGVRARSAALGEAERRFQIRRATGALCTRIPRGPADGGLGRRQCRRAADGGGWNHYGRIRDTRRRGGSGSGNTSTIVPRTYSGGMRRLQIARNLVTEPRLVFMD